MVLRNKNGTYYSYSEIKEELERGIKKKIDDTGEEVALNLIVRPGWFDEVQKGLAWQSLNPKTCVTCNVTTIICPRCEQMVTWQGCHVDHIVEWKQWIKSFCKDQQNPTLTKVQAKVLYNALCNLQIMCGTCNSMKDKFKVQIGPMKGTHRIETRYFAKQTNLRKRPKFDGQEVS